MKKLILSIFVAGGLAFGLQSCGDACDDVTCATGEICVDGECEADPNFVSCADCGDYSGTISSGPGSSLVVQGLIDSVLVDFPGTANVTETSLGNVNLTVSLSINGIAIAPTVPATYENNVVTVTNAIYNYNGIVDISVDGTMTFDGNGGTTGNLTLGNGPATPVPAVSGDLVFSGTKQ